jgi:hypothetical protein
MAHLSFYSPLHHPLFKAPAAASILEARRGASVGPAAAFPFWGNDILRLANGQMTIKQ